MRRMALTVAMFGFLVLAGIGLASDVPTFDTALRALGGAAILYFVVSLGGKMALNIVVDAIVNSAPKADRNRENEQ